MAARELAAKLEGKSVTVPVKVGENGKLFGTVSGKEVSAALESQLAVAVDKKKISLSEPIRATGEYTAKVSLFEGTSATVRVVVKES